MEPATDETPETAEAEVDELDLSDLEQLLDELRIGLDSAHTYLYLFQNTSAVIKSRAEELKKCLNEHIDLSEPEISVIT